MDELKAGEVARILLIEDDPAIVELVQQLLGYAAHDVNVVFRPDGLGDGARDVDLVVTDLFERAATDGTRRYIDRIRQAVGAAPILICSGQAPLSQSMVSRLGVVDVIAKPFDVEDFILRIDVALQQSARLQSNVEKPEQDGDRPSDQRPCL